MDGAKNEETDGSWDFTEVDVQCAPAPNSEAEWLAFLIALLGDVEAALVAYERVEDAERMDREWTTLWSADDQL